jgi:hypothetical protein
MNRARSRRDFLGLALVAGALPIMSGAARAAFPAPKRLVAGTRTLAVNGRSARVLGLVGPDGRPGLRLDPGERFRVDLANESGTHTLVATVNLIQTASGPAVV